MPGCDRQVEITRHEVARRFAEAVERVRDYAMFLLDTEGTILTWNRGAEEMKGYSAAQAVGRFFGILYTQDAQVEGVPSSNLAAAAENDSFQEESWRRRRDGSLFWALIELIALRDDQGELVGFCKITRDLTGHKELQMRLSEEKRRAEVTLATIADAVVSVDPEGRIQFMNARAEQMSGVPSAQAVGKLFGTVFSLRDAAGAPNPTRLAEALPARGKPEAPAIAMLVKDGMSREIEYSVCAIQSNGDQVAGCVVVLRDITECRRSEEALKQADRRKDEFLAMLAHELRNPLAPISAAATLLARGSLDNARVRSTSEVIARQVRHMSELIDDLLDAARVTRGKVELEKVLVDMRSVVSEAIEQVRPLVTARAHVLDAHLPVHGVWVEGDRKRLVQVVANLLGNAAKYTPDKGRIVLTMTLDRPDRMRLAVNDNGIGMSAEFAKRAFQLFSQAERASDRAQGGLGIGLALVKSLVELHGGSVRVESPGLQQGCTFTVTLPIQSADLQELRLVRSDSEPIAAAADVPLRILVVDDNVDAARLLAVWLEDMGHEVAVEYDSAQALARARRELPQVCLLDIGLPNMDGVQLARLIRSSPGLEATVLVALTGYSQPADRQYAAAGGFDHYMVKPADPQRLRGILQSAGADRPSSDQASASSSA